MASDWLNRINWSADGLIPVVTQEVASGRVLTLAWANREALQRTAETLEVHYWSRSRKALWRKGDTSGDRQFIREAYYDCDGDTLLMLVEQEGKGACHTGEYSCFYRPFGA